MLAIKKRAARGVVLWAAVTGGFLLAGCAPPGPRALLEGEKLIQEGKYGQAVEKLELATRLLPKYAQAWNHLGLAYHGLQQPERALRAYRKALSLDHKLASTRYNLGCLYLEQNNAIAAVDELTSYTLLESRSLDGWLRLGSAQVRVRRWDSAEKSFRNALELYPRHPEALNGLGVVQLQRKRVQDALYCFNLALAQKPQYGPALLNLAVVTHQNLNNHSLALQRYREYLALQPRPVNWEAVEATARRLDLELHPPRLPPVNLAAPGVSRTNLAPEPAPTISPAKAPTSLARTNPASPAQPAKPAATTLAGTNAASPAGRAVPAEPVKSMPPSISKVAELEVTRLPEDLVVKPPQEIPSALPPNTNRDIGSGKAAPPPLASKENPQTPKRGFFERLNPFAGSSRRSATNTVTASDTRNRPDKGGVESQAGSISNAPSPARVSIPEPSPVARYTYLSPARPAPGNRNEAERHFATALRAQKAARYSEALEEYEKAAQLDPAYFEARYNQGWVAHQSGNWKQALSAYEHALAIQPDSIDARYNFALVLKQASYFQDAADELVRLLRDNPGETRAHLSLANLFAQQLDQPSLAREHYQRVLEREPRHPQAAQIRYWLAANP